MSNAAKHRKKAAEFEQLKQIDRAIASYVRAIEESESDGEDVDVALLNKVGDLALRQGRVPDAVTYYERAVEHYATAGLFNNAIALCNKILRNAPGRSNVYFTLGRICARKGLRGDATRNFLEYAARMQQEGRVEEAMRALGEVADLTPELTEVRRLVDEHAVRAGVELPRRRTPIAVEAVVAPDAPRFAGDKSSSLVFLEVDYSAANARLTPPIAPRAQQTVESVSAAPEVPARAPVRTPPIALPFIDLQAPPLAASRESPPLPDLELVAEPLVLPAASERQAHDALDSLRMIDETSAHGTAPELEPEVELELELSLEADITPESDSAIEPTEELLELDNIGLLELPMLDLHGADAVVGDDAPSDSVDGIEELVMLDPPTLALLETPIEPTVETPVKGTPAIDAPAFRPRTPLSVSRIPVIEAAIAAGAEVAARAAAERPVTRRPPFRLDPHDFILPGELPPLLVDDAFVEAGLRRASAAQWSLQPHKAPIDIAHDGAPDTSRQSAAATANELSAGVATRRLGRTVIANATPVADHDVEAITDRVDGIVVHHDGPSAIDAGLDLELGDHLAAGANTDLERELRAAIEATQSDETLPASRVTLHTEHAPSESVRGAVRLTPSLPIGAVAAEAIAVAESRRDELRAAVAASPQDWALRRRLAEALFEAGQREAALAELEASLQGFGYAGKIADAADISEELVRVSPERVSYHQKRVELAVRLNDQQRLRLAYLDLADALVRSGEEGRAQAVYVRVLEIDPLDDRARAALGNAAPPPPAPTPDAEQEGFVNLADWLRDDNAPASTRMRMREPVVSGDEQADFAALLRHFKDGVSRSLGDEDFESRYDLGVAFKEMGLLDDAIGEFQKALRSKTHRLPAYEALGQCFVEQGQFQIAATVLSRALHEPGLDDEKRVGVLYLLAYSCEALQRRGEARSYFQRVYATDINFRDVAARLAALEQVAL